MARNPGKSVKHKDGRKGIVYNKDQHGVPKGKVKVKWDEGHGEPSLVDPFKLKVIGFVD